MTRSDDLVLDQAAKMMELALSDLAASRGEVEEAVARLQRVIAAPHSDRRSGEDP